MVEFSLFGMLFLDLNDFSASSLTLRFSFFLQLFLSLFSPSLVKWAFLGFASLGASDSWSDG